MTFTGKPNFLVSEPSYHCYVRKGINNIYMHKLLHSTSINLDSKSIFFVKYY